MKVHAEMVHVEKVIAQAKDIVCSDPRHVEINGDWDAGETELMEVGTKEDGEDGYRS